MMMVTYAIPIKGDPATASASATMYEPAMTARPATPMAGNPIRRFIVPVCRSTTDALLKEPEDRFSWRYVRMSQCACW